ncbi:MAG: hypothetical protein K2H80_00240, partial [Ureaplasma sp.]|nr:hypothetical protein [Ureaplasma sp.]
MFDSFKGKLVFKQKNKIYLENDHGLKEIYVENEENFLDNNEYHLYIYCSKLVSHKSIEKVTNFGFKTIKEMCCFEELINIEGVGPKTALRFINGGIDIFNDLVKNKMIDEMIDKYRINLRIANIIINRRKFNENSELTSSELKKLNEAIMNLQNIGYNRE